MQLLAVSCNCDKCKVKVVCTQNLITATTFCTTCKIVTDKKTRYHGGSNWKGSKLWRCERASVLRQNKYISHFAPFFTPKGVTELNTYRDTGQSNGTYIDVSGESASSQRLDGVRHRSTIFLRGTGTTVRTTRPDLLTYLFTYFLLPPRSTVLLEKLSGSQLVMKF